MRIIEGIEKLKNKKFASPVTVAIGTFDGVHQAHRKIIEKAVSYARRRGGTSIVLTFYPHPLRVIAPHKSPSLLTGIAHRLKLIAEMAPDLCLVADFTRDFSGMSAPDFVDAVLTKQLRTERIVVGENFAFGKDRSGDAAFLRKCGLSCGFSVTVVKPVKLAGRIISSTLIRRLIESGRLDQADKLLGRRFSVLGTVVRGDGRGRLLGYPTANIDPHQEALPPAGVYGVKVSVRGKLYGGMVYIGGRPTFYGGSGKTSVEVNIFGMKKNIYGQDIELFFLKKLRGDKKFSSARMLEQQMSIDKARALELLGGKEKILSIDE